MMPNAAGIPNDPAWKVTAKVLAVVGTVFLVGKLYLTPNAVPGPSQDRFCDVVQGYIRDYLEAEKTGANEAALSQLRYNRKQSLSSIMNNGQIAGWTGLVKQITTDSDGTGHLSVRLSCGSELGSQVELFSKQGIPQGTAVYSALIGLKPDSKIVLSGAFEILPGEDAIDYIDEKSLTERGSMTNPEFGFAFKSILPAVQDTSTALVPASAPARPATLTGAPEHAAIPTEEEAQSSSLKPNSDKLRYRDMIRQQKMKCESVLGAKTADAGQDVVTCEDHGDEFVYKILASANGPVIAMIDYHTGAFSSTAVASAPLASANRAHATNFADAEMLIEKAFDAQFQVAPVTVRLEGPHALETPDLVNLGDYVWPLSTEIAGKIVAEIRAQSLPCGSVASIQPILGGDRAYFDLRGWSVICSAGTYFYHLITNSKGQFILYDVTNKTVAESDREESEAAPIGHKDGTDSQNVTSSAHQTVNQSFVQTPIHSASASGNTSVPIVPSVEVVKPSPASDFPNPSNYYPAESIRMREAGTPVVHVCVGPDGEALDEPTVVRSSGSARLDAGALQLAKAGHYNPGTEDAKPVTACINMSVKFQLRN